MKKEYKEKIQEFKKLLKSNKTEEIEDELWDLVEYLTRQNSFENPLDTTTAEIIVERQQRRSLDIHGGYPLRSEASFEVNGEGYTVISYGAGDEDAIFGMIFVKENDESKAKIH